MYKKFRVIIILSTLVKIIFAQNFIGINTGFTLSSAIGNTQSPSIFLGRKIDSFLLYIGFDFEYQGMVNKYKEHPEYSNDDLVISATPTLGIRYTIKEQKYSPFLNINLSKEYPISIKHNKSESEDENDVEEAESFLKDQNDNISGNLSIGIEYTLSENISFSGEYGLSILLYNYTIADYFIHENTFITTKSALSIIYYFK